MTRNQWYFVDLQPFCDTKGHGRKITCFHTVYVKKHHPKIFFKNKTTRIFFHHPRHGGGVFRAVDLLKQLQPPKFFGPCSDSPVGNYEFHHLYIQKLRGEYRGLSKFGSLPFLKNAGIKQPTSRVFSTQISFLMKNLHRIRGPIKIPS